MIGSDTNLLVRYLTQDEPAQAEMARRLIEERCTAAAPGFVNRIVLCELVWVLMRGYRLSRGATADVIERLLRTKELVIEDAGDVLGAVARRTVARWERYPELSERRMRDIRRILDREEPACAD